jgi:hypothetical protein
MNRIVTLSLGFTLAACVVIAWASPAVGVTPTLLARGTYDAFKVKTSSHSPVDFDAKAKMPVDVIVRQHDYLPGSSTGWHTHPGRSSSRWSQARSRSTSTTIRTAHRK